MPSASRPSFLRHFGRAADPRRGPDLGDMGTAFALDLVLDQQAASVDPTHPPTERIVRVSAWRAWLGRKLGA